MSLFPRPDQLSDFVRHRLTRFLGGGASWARAGRGALMAVGRGRGRALARYSETLDALEHGHQLPWDQVEPVVEDLLAMADHALSAGRQRISVAWVDLAVRLAYHRSVHYGLLDSPLMVRSQEFLSPFLSSPAAQQMLLRPDGPAPSQHDPARDAGDPPGERPHRVLIVCHSSWTFIDRVKADLSEHGDLEFRSVDVSTLPFPERPSHGLAIRMRGAWNRAQRLHPVPDQMKDPLRWADTVLVEWGTFPFAWFSFLDLSDFRLRVVARIHRFEILTPYPLLARSAAYDAIGFVASPIRSLITSISPRAEQVRELPILQNIHDLRPFSPAEEKDRFRLVQIGWALPIKDVSFSLALLRQLREQDERYVLTLIGPTLEDAASPYTAQWSEQVAAQIEDLGPGVEILGYRSDVAEILASSGYILSSSRAEGTHEAVAEGAAAGCIPVVRDWPEIAPWGGAGMVYPGSWISSSVQEAVDRIRAFQAPDAFDRESTACRAWVLGSRDPATIRQDYVDFLIGRHDHDS